jgi:predicted metal-dependent hydrolase
LRRYAPFRAIGRGGHGTAGRAKFAACKNGADDHRRRQAAMGWLAGSVIQVDGYRMMEPISTPIIRRRVNIDFESAKTPGWHPSRRELEDFLNAISLVFPPGEKFFIESVQNYQDKITDPVLKEQVKRFIYQEAMHTKEHNRANRLLDQSYPYGNDIEKFTGTILSLTQRFTPKAIRLAVTCALEHFTAILAELLLRNQEQFIAESDPAFAAL